MGVKLLCYLVIMTIANSITCFGNSLQQHRLPKYFDIASQYKRSNDYNANYQNLYNPKHVTNRMDSKSIRARYLEENNVVCEVEVTRGIFEEEGYDIYPSEYLNKTCKSSNEDPYKIESSSSVKPEVCLHDDHDVGCQTVYDEIRVIKKHKNKHDCWDFTTVMVGVGCRCKIRFTYDLI